MKIESDQSNVFLKTCLSEILNLVYFILKQILYFRFLSSIVELYYKLYTGYLAVFKILILIIKINQLYVS